ncbi:hypothetical protein [Deinococcus wulumuqiensis]|uniref:Uncharacterized protein n=1 Tax=Deinococcus wulumuqiensis TaxID=980427 RepID=A0AAV4K5M2_9DEIO|nr:hypothetical protein [Deinococcus wulumuqiensis]QII20074.1 hypothetical protein G6R31_04310 [Deinococcus wulumuqiensis R12]GGI87404.1 hypothetical protein GCM10010914_22360 [Deinococcus wulumuqiensis]GGP30009.1 hypothetical protein GCM10008021_16600 [Deinococcus wulumuqiensis]
MMISTHDTKAKNGSLSATVSISGGYQIKDQLKADGYQFDGLSDWQKEISTPIVNAKPTREEAMTMYGELVKQARAEAAKYGISSFEWPDPALAAVAKL